MDTALLNRALDLYHGRPDKTWGLTDCISSVLLDEHGIMAAVTADDHFRQAGYRALLLEGVRCTTSGVTADLSRSAAARGSSQ